MGEDVEAHHGHQRAEPDQSGLGLHEQRGNRIARHPHAAPLAPGIETERAEPEHGGEECEDERLARRTHLERLQDLADGATVVVGGAARRWTARLGGRVAAHAIARALDLHFAECGCL